MNELFGKIVSIAVGTAALAICNTLTEEIGNGVSELWDSIRDDI